MDWTKRLEVYWTSDGLRLDVNYPGTLGTHSETLLCPTFNALSGMRLLSHADMQVVAENRRDLDES